MINNRTLNFWWAIIPYAILIVIVLPKFMGYGMFVDGVIYATIGRNMALGEGSFWSPHYTAAIYPVFFEHPPLAFFLQSILFYIFGDTHVVEKSYTLFMGILQLFLISRLWFEVKKNNLKTPSVLGGGFASFLFVIIPIVFWCIASNELENTLIVFTLLSALFCVKAARQNQAWKTVAYTFCAFVPFLCAFLTKGVFGLYPFVFPFLCYVFLSGRVAWNSLLSQILFLFGALVSFLALYAYTPSRYFLGRYLEEQVYASVTGQREINNSHFAVLFVFFQNLIVPFSVCLACCIVAFFYKRKNFFSARDFYFFSASRGLQQTKYLFLSMALSASLPLLLSAKNHGWYLMISMPFYALFFADAFKESIVFVKNKIPLVFLNRVSFFLVISLFLVTIGLSVHNWNRVFKGEYHNDFTVQPMENIRGVMLSACENDFLSDWEKWTMVANLARDYQIDFTFEQNHKYQLFRIDTPCTIPAHCRAFHPKNPSRYQVYDCE